MTRSGRRNRWRVFSVVTVIAVLVTLSGCPTGLDGDHPLDGDNGYPRADAADQIAAVRLRGVGDDINLPINGAVVTYAKPSVGSDPDGFFLQATASGPAVFLRASALNGHDVAVGDAVTFEVIETHSVHGRLEIGEVADFELLQSNVAFDHLVVDVSDADDLVSGLNLYESRVLAVSGSVTTEPSMAGTGYVQVELETAAVQSNDLLLRIPSSLQESVGLSVGCTVTAHAIPMWRFQGVAQLSPHVEADFVLIDCPVP